MLRNKQQNSQQNIQPKVLKGFEGVSRFWNGKNKKWMAKIKPGEFYVSKSDEVITTVLGSCVSACIYDKNMKIGGMNHFMLPLTDESADKYQIGKMSNVHKATRYGNYAMEHLINEIIKYGGLRKCLKVKLFGGSQINNHISKIGKKNIEFVFDYSKKEKLNIETYDLGSNYARKIIFDPRSGKVWQKKITHLNNEEIFVREENYQHDIVADDVASNVELF